MIVATRNRTSAPLATCGFCMSGNHAHCPRALITGAKLWLCLCDVPGCDKSLRCVKCRTTDAALINPDTWQCQDTQQCAARVAARLDANPTIQRIRQIKEKRKMSTDTISETETETTETTATPKTPKTGTCIVTGQTTKGGKFAPGMDARYVSLRVKEVLDHGRPVEDVLVEMDDYDLSQVLKDKFVRGVDLARERQRKIEQRAADRERADAERAAAKEAERERKAAEKERINAEKEAAKADARTTSLAGTDPNALESDEDVEDEDDEDENGTA